MRQIFIIALLILTACSKPQDSGAAEYLLPWADENGEFHLRKIFIETLSAPDRAAGPAAEVFFEPNFTEAGFPGKVAQPRVTKANGVYIPRDVGSAMALAVYANFERIQKFDRRILQSTSVQSLLSWPRRIGIEMQLVGTDSGMIEHNNARFYGDQDAMALFPLSGGDAIPLALNSAILAHEHFHAFFHKTVISVVDEQLFYPGTPVALRGQPKELKEMDFDAPKDFNLFVLRAWNEGLADFYSTIYTKAPHMMSASLPLSGLDARNLDGEFTGLLNANSFREQLKKGQWANLERSPHWCHAVICAYRQGTQVARLLYQFSGTEGEKILRQIIQNLNQLSVSSLSALSLRFMELDEAVGVLLAGVPLDSQRCGVLRRGLSTHIMNTRFAACVSL